MANSLNFLLSRDKKSINDFYSTGALISHPGLVQVVECLYALYNIQFAFIPVNHTHDLDINWPNTASTLLTYGPGRSSPVLQSPAVTPPMNTTEEKVKKWLSSGIGTESDKSTANARSLNHRESDEEEQDTLNETNQRTQEYEEKQEVLARVISELENRNADLEEQLNISKAEQRIKKPKRYSCGFFR